MGRDTEWAPVDLRTRRTLVPVVQRVDNAIQRISIGKTNYAIRWLVLSTL